MKHRQRTTIMDGTVVTFAADFDGDEAFGPYEISASRNAVVIHLGDLRSHDHGKAFLSAFRAAFQVHDYLQGSVYEAITECPVCLQRGCLVHAAGVV
jgi:hypothetical protein